MQDQRQALSQRGSFRESVPPTTIRDQAPTQLRETAMRFYNQPHRFYGGVDLHARTMSLDILDQAGQVVLAVTLPCQPQAFLDAIAPFRDDLVRQFDPALTLEPELNHRGAEETLLSIADARHASRK